MPDKLTFSHSKQCMAQVKDTYPKFEDASDDFVETQIEEISSIEEKTSPPKQIQKKFFNLHGEGDILKTS